MTTTTDLDANDFQTALAAMAPEDLGTLYAVITHSITEDLIQAASPETQTNPFLGARPTSQVLDHASADLNSLRAVADIAEALNPRDEQRFRAARTAMTQHYGAGL